MLNNFPVCLLLSLFNVTNLLPASVIFFKEKRNNRRLYEIKCTYLTVTVVTIFPHEVDTMTVLIPKGPFVGQGAVGDSNIVIVVEGGEGATLMVRHGVTWRRYRR